MDSKIKTEILVFLTKSDHLRNCKADGYSKCTCGRDDLIEKIFMGEVSETRMELVK